MAKDKFNNISLKYNLLIGLITSLWLFLFLFFIKPFKQHRLDNLSLFYNAIAMFIVILLCYYIVVIIENSIYKKYKKWNIKYEIIISIIFITITFTGIYIIYKTIADGSYNIPTFFIKDFLPTLLILFPITFSLRKYFLFLSNKKVSQKTIILYGKNKLDYLKIDKNDLISISSFQNYVEISFLIKNQLHTKLIRNSLKKTHDSFPFLKQVHRSHLINPSHFISFKNSKTLTLTMKEIPFSNTYKENIKST